MHLTDHISDVQLNEYLDNETAERAEIESHLSSCNECAARLTALQTLFNEIESLPELALSHSIATRFTSTPNLIVPQLPRWLTLTASLQAVLALISIIFVAPFVTQLLAPYLQANSIPSWSDAVLELQITFVVWMQSLGSISLPEIPSNVFALPTELTPEIISVSLFGMLLVWLVGNWWLLHKKINSLA